MTDKSKIEQMLIGEVAFFKALSETKNVSDVIALAGTDLTKLGVEMMSYHFVPPFHSQTSERAIVITRGFPEEWTEKYNDPEFRASDPIPDIVMAQHDWMHWEDALDKCKDKKAAKTFREDLEKHNIPPGIGIPLYGPGGRDAYCAMGIGREFDDDDDLSLIIQIRQIMQAVHLRISHLTIEQINIGKALSMRETEVLSWVLAGKSRNDIATILGISPATVDTYLRRIFEKMEAHDKVKASLRALSQGLIKFK